MSQLSNSALAPLCGTWAAPELSTDKITSELVPLAADWGVRVVGVLVALWISFIIANWLQRKVTGTLKERKFDEALALFFGDLVKWGVVIAAVLACLSIVGIEATSFSVVLGAAGLAIGLAFQGTLSNFAAGVMLLTFRPFKIGDLIKVAGELGIVNNIGLFTVALDTLDNRRIILPNATVTGGIIENLTHNDKRRVDIAVGVSYDADLRKARDVLENVASTAEHRDDEHGHQVILLELGDSSINWQVRIWTSTDKYWDVWDATVLRIKEALDEAKISIPFPQMDVHVKGQPPRLAGLKA